MRLMRPFVASAAVMPRSPISDLCRRVEPEPKKKAERNLDRFQW